LFPLASSPTNTGYTSQQDVADRSGDFNAQSFLIKQALASVETCTLVRVVAVTNAGGITPGGFVDVQPLVNQTDGAGNATPHGTIHGLPYFRLQGGANAVIIDPVIGDIGMAGFSSRDISSVKANKAQANPGSSRRHDPADGLYFGGLLNGVPTQFIAFTASGIQITSPTAVTITAPTITLNGNVASTGTLANNGHAVGSTHQHLASGGSGIGGVPQ
jgi:hypothetical protein